MSIFHNHRIDDAQLRAILHELPRVNAPEDLETNLARSIAENVDHLPHMLGAMPLVPAHEDFDQRLMDAIQERRRPDLPIPQQMIGDGWFATYGSRWITSAVVIAGILVVGMNLGQTPTSQPVSVPASVVRTVPAPAALPLTPAPIKSEKVVPQPAVLTGSATVRRAPQMSIIPQPVQKTLSSPAATPTVTLVSPKVPLLRHNAEQPTGVLTKIPTVDTPNQSDTLLQSATGENDSRHYQQHDVATPSDVNTGGDDD